MAIQQTIISSEYITGIHNSVIAEIEKILKELYNKEGQKDLALDLQKEVESVLTSTKGAVHPVELLEHTIEVIGIILENVPFSNNLTIQVSYNNLLYEKMVTGREQLLKEIEEMYRQIELDIYYNEKYIVIDDLDKLDRQLDDFEKIYGKFIDKKNEFDGTHCRWLDLICDYLLTWEIYKSIRRKKRKRFF